ncbi:unnamed protein product [Gadus morhua 'NCC']
MDPYCFTWGGNMAKSMMKNTKRQEPCVALRQASSGCQGRGGAPTGLALGGAGLRAIPLGSLTPLLRKAECILQKLNCSQSLEENTGVCFMPPQTHVQPQQNTSPCGHRTAIVRSVPVPARVRPGVFSVALATRCLQAGEGVAWREIRPGTGQEASGGRFTVAVSNHFCGGSPSPPAGMGLSYHHLTRPRRSGCWLLAAGRRCRWARFSLMADPPRAPER